MTLNEAILHAEEVAEEKDMQARFETDYECYKMSDYERSQCKKCAEEHRQLAEWLKDYRRLKEQEPYDELDFVQPHKKVLVNLKICKMREATQEEREGIERYIDSIAESYDDAAAAGV